MADSEFSQHKCKMLKLAQMLRTNKVGDLLVNMPGAKHCI